jgi:hypothetical protein
MTAHTIDRQQRTAAKIAGAIYIVAMVVSMFAEFYIRGPLIVAGDAVKTANNIIASQQLFRISSGIHLLVSASDAVLGVCFYVILRNINKPVALLGAFWRLADSVVLAVSMLADFAALRLLAGTEYLRVFEEPQLKVLARVFIGVGVTGFQIAFVLLGLGSALFAWLWLKSGYIPRLIAAWGIFSSLLIGLGSLAIMVFPVLSFVGLSYMAPMFFYEVGLGLWLLIKGLRDPSTQVLQ